MGLYSGIFYPPSDGLYDFSAEFTADTSCTGDLCAPKDFSEIAPGRCQILVQGEPIDVTVPPGYVCPNDNGFFPVNPSITDLNIHHLNWFLMRVVENRPVPT